MQHSLCLGEELCVSSYTIWAITFLPCSVGCDFPYKVSALCVLLIIGSQGADTFVLLPSQASNICIASFSLAIFILLSRGLSSLLLSFLVVIIYRWCLLIPIGIISVFLILNFTPDTLHHSLRILWT
jgi:hypothetical protein